MRELVALLISSCYGAVDSDMRHIVAIETRIHPMQSRKMKIFLAHSGITFVLEREPVSAVLFNAIERLVSLFQER